MFEPREMFEFVVDQTNQKLDNTKLCLFVCQKLSQLEKKIDDLENGNGGKEKEQKAYENGFLHGRFELKEELESIIDELTDQLTNL